MTLLHPNPVNLLHPNPVHLLQILQVSVHVFTFFSCVSSQYQNQYPFSSFLTRKYSMSTFNIVLGTVSPTKSPTDKPSVSPTTLAPVEIIVTASPTVTETLPPTDPPYTKSPISNSPTLSPEQPPSDSPVASGAITPTYSPVASGDIIGPIETTGLKVTLGGIRSIESNSEWERATSDYFAEIYNDSSNMYDAEVELVITGIVSGTTTSSRRLNNIIRSLQSSDSSVEVTYTQTMSYRSSDSNLTNNNEIVQYPLSTEPFRDRYVGELKLLNGYEDLTDVSTISITSDSDKGIDGGNESSSNLPLGAIIGGAGAAAALLILIAGFVYHRRKKKDDDENFENQNAGSATLSSTQDMRTTSGAGTGSSVPTYGDQSVATVDYDYSRAYGGAGAHSLSDAGGTLGSRTRQTAAEDDPAMLPASGNTIFSDDQTFDQAYEDVREELMDIYAPQGKLGVVIDTPDCGAPVVHAVKDTSPIATKIQVGDKLVAVDDEDVRAMTAIKVSKLISRKSNNASRKLTIIRHVSNQS